MWIDFPNEEQEKIKSALKVIFYLKNGRLTIP